jgi:type I restriction enzyme S subunit
MDSLVQSLFYDMFGDPVLNPMGWETKELNKVIIGKATNGFFAKNQDYSSNGAVGVVWIGDFINKFYCDYSNLRKITPKNQELKKYSINYGDILFCRSSLNVEGIGKAACVPETNEPIMFECHIIKVTLNQNYLIPEFFKILSDTKYFRSQIMKNAKTSTMTTIGQNGILNCHIIIPPMKMQKFFLNKLQKIETQKQKMQKSLKDLEQNFSSLMQRALKGEI